MHKGLTNEWRSHPTERGHWWCHCADGEVRLYRVEPSDGRSSLGGIQPPLSFTNGVSSNPRPIAWKRPTFSGDTGLSDPAPTDLVRKIDPDDCVSFTVYRCEWPIALSRPVDPVAPNADQPWQDAPTQIGAYLIKTGRVDWPEVVVGYVSGAANLETTWLERVTIPTVCGVGKTGCQTARIIDECAGWKWKFIGTVFASEGHK